MKLNETKEGRTLFNYILVRPININPYIIRKSASGLILSSGMPMEMSNETGQMEKLEQRIAFGVVIDAGSECKEVKVGDEVYYDRMSTRALPILDLGYAHMHEGNVMYVVTGEGDTIGEAHEFEETLRKELAQGAAKAAEEDKNKQITDSLESRGITIKRY